MDTNSAGGMRARRRSALLAVLALGGAASAASWRTGSSVVVGAGETVRDDLYLSGSDVRVEGTVTGDLIAAGQTVTVNGEVQGNVWAAGGTVTLNGKVLHTARLAGSVLNIGRAASVGDDLLAAGAGLDVAPGARIGRDLMFGGQQTRLGGTIARNAYIGANAVDVSGVVGRNANLTLGSGAALPRAWLGTIVRPADQPVGLHFAPGGRVVGGLALKMTNRPALPPNAVGGQVSYSALPAATPQTAPVSTFGTLLANLLRSFMGVALAALLLRWWARRPLDQVTERLRAAPWASLGYGALLFVILPLLVLLGGGVVVSSGALLGAVGLGNLGLPLALIGGPALLALALLLGWAALLAAQGLSALLLGRWLLSVLRSAPEPTPAPTPAPRPIWALLLGAGLLAMAFQLPMLGGLLSVLTLMFALGALWQWWRGTPGQAQRKTMYAGPIGTPHVG